MVSSPRNLLWNILPCSGGAAGLSLYLNGASDPEGEPERAEQVPVPWHQGEGQPPERQHQADHQDAR